MRHRPSLSIVFLFLALVGPAAVATINAPSGTYADHLVALDHARKGNPLSPSELRAFKALVTTYGVPTGPAVGATAADAFARLLIAATDDRKFQYRILHELAGRLGSDVMAQGFAYVSDAIDLSHGDRPSYGAVLQQKAGVYRLPDVLDEDRVEQSRDSIGLDPVRVDLRVANDLLAVGFTPEEISAPPALFRSTVDVPQPELRRDLDRRAATDQASRAAWMKVGGRSGTPAARAVRDGDHANSLAIRAILDRVGFPTVRMVGRRGVSNAYLLIQHSVDQALMLRGLKLVKPLVLRGELARGDFALMVDRTLLLEHKPQIYGTQGIERDGRVVPYNLADAAGVNGRRSLMRMQTLERYYGQMNSAP